jgi:hypothetical protein
MRTPCVTAFAVLLIMTRETLTWAQPQVPAPAYDVSAIYDRLTDSTRVSFALREGSKPFGLDSRAWLDLVFTHSGKRLTAPPAVVSITIESSTPGRKASWAFAGPKPLHIRSEGSAFHLELIPAGYARRLLQSAQPQYRDALSFIVTPEQVEAMAEERVVDLKAGNARMRLGPAEMQMLREAARRMRPAT